MRTRFGYGTCLAHRCLYEHLCAANSSGGPNARKNLCRSSHHSNLVIQRHLFVEIRVGEGENFRAFILWPAKSFRVPSLINVFVLGSIPLRKRLALI